MPQPIQPVSDAELDDLHRRLAATRQPRLPLGVGWARGTDADFLHALLDTWRHRYDWRAHEARILGFPWETVGAGDQVLRVVHQRADRRDAPAVVLLHGWPDSVLRFERLLHRLDGVHVVVPALPGFPFAYELTRPGMTSVVMASCVANAMQALGYDRYVVSAGDFGADVAEQLAALHPERIAALHLTNISPLHAAFADRSAMGTDELRYLDAITAWQRAEGGYIAQQSTKPHTLAPGLVDSPAGLAAWLVEKLRNWSGDSFAEDDLLTWISAYWFTGTIGTSFAPFVEFMRPPSYVRTPTVLSAFGHDFKLAPRGFASRFVNVQEYIGHDEGGHFAAWEQPEHYAADLGRAIALGQRKA